MSRVVYVHGFTSLLAVF